METEESNMHTVIKKGKFTYAKVSALQWGKNEEYLISDIVF